MYSELITAVKERQELGYSVDMIRDELKTAGHDDETIKQVFSEIGIETDGLNLVSISSASNLLSESFDFLKKRIDLLFALFAPVALITILEYLVTTLPVSQLESAKVVVGVISLFSFIFYILLSLSTLYVVTQKSEREVSVRESLVWAKKNVWPMFWIYILMALVVWGGFILFIIPGIILWITVHFSQYVYIQEGLKGMSALRRSRDLVKGSWLSLARPLSLVGLFILFSFILLSGISSLAEVLFSGNNLVEMFLVLLLDLLTVGASIVGFVVGAQLYRDINMKPKKSGLDFKLKEAWVYITLAIVGLVSLVVILANLSELDEYEQTDIGGSIESRIGSKERAVELRVSHDKE